MWCKYRNNNNKSHYFRKDLEKYNVTLRDYKDWNYMTVNWRHLLFLSLFNVWYKNYCNCDNYLIKDAGVILYLGKTSYRIYLIKKQIYFGHSVKNQKKSRLHRLFICSLDSYTHNIWINTWTWKGHGDMERQIYQG